MAFVRYQSPDDSTFTVFDLSRFRVEHALFLLKVEPLRERLDAKLEEQRGWNLAAMKLVEENRRIAACREWLDKIPADSEVVVIPELKHEPAIDVVADGLIAEGHFDRAFCPACELEYRPDEIAREPWQFEEEGVTLRGSRSVCPKDHTIHVLTEAVDAIDLEGPDEPDGGPM